MKGSDIIVILLYGIFLFISSLYFILAGSALVDSLGIDRHVPCLLTPVIVAFTSSLMFTALSSVPLAFTKRKGIRRAVFMLFSASFAFYSIVVWFFLGLK
ncbi:hypothetical protein [Thermococcus sp. MV11]|uniref:hypothetical protein n=1 Tax=Thermococcus sp. MV11 TaxID=1638267 RepID=UPI0014301A3D|nr:hypothetical protein [Thermococcus sp. MV11]NJE03194.1 hypothetical protein [Thermococcus sp. MV11]